MADDVAQGEKTERYANLALAGLVVYTLVLAFAALDELLGWGILAPYF